METKGLYQDILFQFPDYDKWDKIWYEQKFNYLQIKLQRHANIEMHFPWN